MVRAGEGADALVVGSEEPAFAVVLQAEWGEGGGGGGSAWAHQGNPKGRKVRRVPKHRNDHDIPLEEVCSGLEDDLVAHGTLLVHGCPPLLHPLPLGPAELARLNRVVCSLD